MAVTENSFRISLVGIPSHLAQQINQSIISNYRNFGDLVANAMYFNVDSSALKDTNWEMDHPFLLERISLIGSK